ncbi:phosphoenolpyruvate synthase [Patescibacteria group bacterium]|nr:phosphoenolpyruvate synthase [Patescibacteria group bacterium]
MAFKNKRYILWFKNIKIEDVPFVGGKNASLGEMYRNLTAKDMNIPNGFALTSKAYFYFLKENGIDKELKTLFNKFNPKSIDSLQSTGKQARKLILDSEFPIELERKIRKNYKKLCTAYRTKDLIVAVRSSATAEDLPTASFAGQQETYLNVSGEEEVLKASKKCIASLFTDRAIAYREGKGFDHLEIALSVCIQKMIGSGTGSAGVMFTLDTETGFENVVLINSIWGVGELIVKGKITSDEFYVFKPKLKQGFKSIIVKNLGRKTKKMIYSKKGGVKEIPVSKENQLKFSLTDNEILTLAKWGCEIEDYYSKKKGKYTPQDIEWAKDGRDGKLYIVQARPETVHSAEKKNIYKEYDIKTKKEPILTGIAIGDKIGQGRVSIISNVRDMNKFKQGEVLVTKMTDPDWVPIMKIASAIVTDEGSKTAHAAIVSRELGIPCIVGTRTATKKLKSGQMITVDCAMGLNGRIFEGKVPFSVKEYNLKKVPKSKTKISVNIGAPELAFKTSFLPVKGVGLAREEFIIAQKIQCHPMALYNFDKLKDKKVKKKIEALTIEHKDKKEFFIKELAEGIGQIAAAFWPNEVIVRFSDFKTNEYAQLIGGELYEPKEENPMLGWRGASRYYDERFIPAFGMECAAIKRVREVFGLDNVALMVPFCRTPEEGKKVLDLMKKFKLEKGVQKLKVYVMCEIPSNVMLVDKFLDIFDGMSIGSNDLTQLTMGMDRDNAEIVHIADERNEAVKEMLKIVIRACKKRNKYIGICGEAPSTYPEFAEFLAKEKIDALSLSPDAVVKTMAKIAGK